MIKGDSYGKEERWVTELIEEKVAALKECVRLCLEHRVSEIHETTARSEQTLARVDENLVGSNRRLSLVRNEIHDSGKKIESRLAAHEELVRTVVGAIDSIRETLRERVRTAECKSQVGARRCLSNSLGIGKQAILEQIIHAATLPEKRYFELNVFDLKAMLSVPDNLATEDMGRALSMGRLASSSSQLRTGEALRDPAFQTWFGSARSCMLAINGMERRVGGVSAMSHLVALMRETLADDQSVIPLTYFCGDHIEAGDAIYGASGAMRSICMQVIMSLPEGSGLRCENVSLINGIHSHGIEHLCELFRRLLAALATCSPGKVVFCMIDDISCLHEYTDDVIRLITQLRAITYELLCARQPVILKTLFTSAMYCEDLESLLDPAEIVTLRRDIHNTGTSAHARLTDFEVADDPYDIF